MLLRTIGFTLALASCAVSADAESHPAANALARDAVYTNAAGLPTYIATGIELDRNQDRSHGRDERVGVQAFYRGVEFCYRYLKAVTTP